MTIPKIIRNVYCADLEDRVRPRGPRDRVGSCPCCRRCWLFVASRKNLKNNTCPYGGPFDGYVKVGEDVK